MCTDSARQTLAIFDFDGTLLRSDSMRLFLRFAAGQRIWWLWPRMVVAFLGYKIGCYDAARSKGKLLQIVIRGMHTEQVNEMCQRFANLLSKYERPEAIAVLHKHLSAGHRVCIVSASPTNWITPWAAMHGISEVYGTALEEKSGRITGALDGTNCAGQAKVTQLNQSIPRFAELYNTYAYGDSAGDRELLASVRHPYYRTFPASQD